MSTPDPKPRARRSRRTPEGDAILKAETTPPPSDDPSPKDSAPRDTSDDPTPDEPKKRGRPRGSRNASKRATIEASARTFYDRATQLAGFSIFANPALPPQRKVVFLNDVEILRSEDGANAVVGALMLAVERNSKLEATLLRMIAASAYTGIGATVVFGLMLPILTNHGMIPPAVANMLGVQMPDSAIEVREPIIPDPPPNDPSMHRPYAAEHEAPPPVPPPPPSVDEMMQPSAVALEFEHADPEGQLKFGRTEIDPEMFG